MAHDYGKCHVCGSAIEERCIDHSIHEGGGWFFIRGVPTGVCTKCGEQVLRWQVLQRLEKLTQARTIAVPAERIEVPVYSY